MIRSKQVTVLRPVKTGTDAMNADIYDWEEEPPVYVVATPESAAEVDEGRTGEGRFEGVKVTYTLHFQKSYTNSLRGCKVVMDGRQYRVIGDPQPYMPENTPGLYNRPVKVVLIDG